MSQNWQEFLDAAQELVEFFGATYEYRQFHASADPVKPWVSLNVAPTIFNPTAVFIATDRLGKEFLHQFGVTELAAGSEICIMHHQGFYPQTNDVILRNGSAMRIDNCNTWKPADVPLLHIIEFVR